MRNKVVNKRFSMAGLLRVLDLAGNPLEEKTLTHFSECLRGKKFVDTGAMSAGYYASKIH
jgi:hypothetical protein